MWLTIKAGKAQTIAWTSLAGSWENTRQKQGK
jgi:hypothetical protein